MTIPKLTGIILVEEFILEVSLFMQTIIDITNDVGYERLVGMLKEGSLSKLKEDTDVDMLLQKQAYADANTFADTKNRMFSIATPVEAYISARYAEKCASELPPAVVDRINEACDIFNLGIEVEKVAKVVQANDMFTEKPSDVEKYDGCTEYGTEFEKALAARIMTFPEHAEEYENLANVAKEVPPKAMVEILKEVDSYTGADMPWVASKVGTPDYAVFAKVASDVTVDLVSKTVPFEKVAEVEEAINDMGVSIDFDANDAYSIKLALERLPVQIRKAIAQLV